MRAALLILVAAAACVPDETGPAIGSSHGLGACTDDAIASAPDQRCVTFRALTGASMGGGGAARVGFSHPELFDVVGIMGSPLTDLDALWSLIRSNYLGGFCPLADIEANPDVFCGKHDFVPESYDVPYQPAVDDDYATPDGRCPAFRSDFNHWYRGPDEGRGTSFDREFFIKVMLDLVKAFGSPANSTALSRAWNPTGAHPVLAVKDGGAPNSGDFDPAYATWEIPFINFVDVNQNGRRDYGEPVIISDVEPDDDSGLDGIPGTGDFGEGNGKRDVSPGLESWRAQSPTTHYTNMSDAQVARLNVWIDAGIRDFLNSAQVTNRLFAAMQARGADTRFFQGFRALPGRPEGKKYSHAYLDTSLEALGRVAYMQYGDPKVCPGSDDVLGDGNHVGPEIIDRIFTLFTFAASRMPEDDRRSALGGATGPLEDFAFTETFASEALGRDVEYGVMLPPDYYDEPERRWPVIYFLHGQGDSPQKLLGLNFVLLGPMKESVRPDRQAEYLNDMQRAIVIFPDGRCHDACHTGSNYADFVDGGPAFEQALLELMRVVEGRYRTLAPRFDEK
jgi:hypothetical protein